MGLEEYVVAIGVAPSVVAAPLVLFDASRLRMSSTLAWPVVVLVAPIVGLLGYLHFRRIHLKRLRDYAAATNMPALSIAPLSVLKKDLAMAAIGAVLVVVALAILANENVRHLPIALGVAGMALVARAAKNVQGRAL